MIRIFNLNYRFYYGKKPITSKGININKKRIKKVVSGLQ